MIPAEVSLDKDGFATVADVYKSLAPTEKAWDDKMYLQPIPANEMERTGGQLVQNPGY